MFGKKKTKTKVAALGGGGEYIVSPPATVSSVLNVVITGAVKKKAWVRNVDGSQALVTALSWMNDEREEEEVLLRYHCAAFDGDAVGALKS